MAAAGAGASAAASSANGNLAQGPTTGGALLTMTGSGFMAPLRVYIGGAVCQGTPVITAGTTVTGLVVPPGAGKDLPIVVESGNLPPQMIALTFSYRAPDNVDPPKDEDDSGCSRDSTPACPAAIALPGLVGAAARRRRWA